MDSCFEQDLFDDIFSPSPSPEETLNASLSSPSTEDTTTTNNNFYLSTTTDNYISVGNSPYSFSPTLTAQMNYSPTHVQNSSQFLLDANSLQNLVLPVPMTYVPSLTPIVANSVSDESSSNDGEIEEMGRRKRRNAVRLKNDKRNSPSSSGDEKSVTLSRDELLSFTSEQYEEFVSSIINSRDVTSSEKSEIKRQRRLIKNRESAQASRQRKKLHMDQLERKVKELSSENTVLKENIATLCSENNQLKQHVALLNEVVKKSMGTDLFSRGYNFMNTMANPKQYMQMNPTGVVLMIVLFSFGILFSNWITPTNTFPGTTTVVELPVPQSNPRILDHPDFEYASNSINPLVVLQGQDISTERLEKTTCDAVELRPAIADVSSEQTQNVILSTTDAELSTAVVPSVDTPPRPVRSLFLGPAIGTPLLKTESRIFQDQSLRIPQPHESLRIPQSDELRFSIENETELTELHPHISVWKANTTYLLCGKVSQIQPGAGTLLDMTDTNQQMITFFIPPDKTSTDRMFLTVTCKVVETSFTPSATIDISAENAAHSISVM